jgi:hypothetical protein
MGNAKRLHLMPITRTRINCLSRPPITGAIAVHPGLIILAIARVVCLIMPKWNAMCPPPGAIGGCFEPAQTVPGPGKAPNCAPVTDDGVSFCALMRRDLPGQGGNRSV